MSEFRVLSPIHQANRQAGLHIDGLLADDLGVSAQEGQLLAFVAARDGVPVTALVRLLGVAKSTMTSMLHRLHRAGLIRRRANPEDARSLLLFATAKGRRVGTEARARVLAFERRLQARLSAADKRALTRIVDAVTAETGIDLPSEAPPPHSNERRRSRMDPKGLAFQFAFGDFVFTRNLAGVSHEESLRAPRLGGNTLNWIVGHLVRTRNQALELLGASPLYDDTELSMYGASGFDAHHAMALDELKRRFDALAPVLAAALEAISADRLAEPAPFSPTNNPSETVGTLLASIAFHEAYHLGQTGLSRRLIGKPGALLAPGEEGH